MVEPPLLDGGVKATTAEALPAVAVPMAGAPGTVTGTTALEARDEGPGPYELVATTVKVYVSPLVRPVTVIGPAAALAVWPPLAGVVRSVAVTVYEEMAEPPLLDGGVKATTAEALPAVAVPMVGAPGIGFGTMELDAVEDGPVPTPLVAVTVKV